MNKLFYPKLAGQNIIKNGKFYFPYLLTVVISAAAFYIMTALSYYNDLPEKQRYDYLMMFMTLGSFVLALFIVIFLSYTNSFLMKRRSKELGLYNILGMGKGSIGLVLCWESLYTWLCGIVIGIPLGMLLQKLVMMVVGRMMRFNTVFEFYVSVKGIAATAILFAAVIALTLLNNLRRLHLQRPVELLHGQNAGEREPEDEMAAHAAGHRLPRRGLLHRRDNEGCYCRTRRVFSRHGSRHHRHLLPVFGGEHSYTQGAEKEQTLLL